MNAEPAVIDGDARIAALLADCAAGRRAALEAVYRLTAPRVLAVLLRLLRNRATAEDALQDVYIKVWERARQYEPQRGRPLAWITTIARYHAIDQLRSGRGERSLDEAALDVADENAIPEPESDRTRDLLERCLARLTEEQRRCLRLAYEGGLTHEQVAQAVTKPLGSVKSWIRRALGSLKECMQA